MLTLMSPAEVSTIDPGALLAVIWTYLYVCWHTPHVTLELPLVMRHFAQYVTYRGNLDGHDYDCKVCHSDLESHSRARQTKVQLCDFGYYFQISLSLKSSSLK